MLLVPVVRSPSHFIHLLVVCYVQMEEVKNAIKFEISELHNTPEPELLLTELYHKVSLLTELYHKVIFC